MPFAFDGAADLAPKVKAERRLSLCSDAFCWLRLLIAVNPAADRPTSTIGALSRRDDYCYDDLLIKLRRAAQIVTRDAGSFLVPKAKRAEFTYLQSPTTATNVADVVLRISAGN